MSIIDQADQRLAMHLIVHQLAQLQGTCLLNLLEALRDHSAQERQDLTSCLALLQHFQAAARAVETLRILCVGAVNVELQQIAKQIAWLHAHQVKLLAWGDEDYPLLLKHIAQPPPFLYVRGNSALLHYPQIAVVGARRATPLGLKIAYQLAAELAASGLLVSSGLALGIDARCHHAALDNHQPTLAVLGTGIDLVYPKSHVLLAQQIVEHGVLVSEFPLGAPPLRYHFPQRNRLLSGLSLGVLVVEASEKSGSLITAKYALEQGREVFAVLGSIHNPMASGCHALLKDGANLVACARDVLNYLELSSIVQLQLHHVGSSVAQTKTYPANKNSVVEAASVAAHQQSALQKNTATLNAVEKNDIKIESTENVALKNDMSATQQVYALIEDQGSSLEELQTYTDLSYTQLCEVLLNLECQHKVISQMGLYYKC